MNILGFDIKRAKGKRSFEAADKGRRGKAFRGVKPTGPNAEISQALQVLRSRSRHMVRNNGWAKRAVDAVTRHTVGEGIRPAPLGSKAVNQKIKLIWKNWAETTQCDFYGKNNLYGLQELAMRSLVEGGDMIVVLRKHIPVNDNDLPIKLQLCEGDLIDHTRNGVNEKGVARLGVQFSASGEHIGYWLWNAHPGDLSNFAQSGYPSGSTNYLTNFGQSEYHDKENILHVFEVLRIGQVRGLPFGVASFMKMSDFSDYEDAQLEKQKVAACMAAFVVGSETPPTNEKGEVIRNETLEPGVIEYLGLGESVEFANPPSVGEYDTYTKKILQGIAAAFGITYEMLTMDYSNVNFSSGRMAKIDVTNNFRSWQYNMMVPQFCAPVWEWFIDACLIVGFLTEKVQSDWTAPRVQQLDPVKETNARLLAVQAGFTTISEIIREDGRDPDEFFDEYKSDMERLQSLGINLKSIISAAEVSGGSNQNNNNNGKEQD